MTKPRKFCTSKISQYTVLQQTGTYPITLDHTSLFLWYLQVYLLITDSTVNNSTPDFMTHGYSRIAGLTNKNGWLKACLVLQSLQ